MSDTATTTPTKLVHIHLVSDATGETIYRVARACLVQFEGIEAIQHVWSLVRSPGHLEKVLGGISAHPGPVMFTLVDEKLRGALQDGCRRLQVPLIPVLDPVIGALGSYFGMPGGHQPGKQHMLDAEYFGRIDAMTFALTHDDGQSTWSLDEADVVLVGVSRTSKTPTCMYLANRGIKAGNVPIVPNVPLPDDLFKLSRPLVVGLTNDPQRLVQLRRNRLDTLAQHSETEYTDLDTVKNEVAKARRLFGERGWPVIDVTRRSIEETAAAILQLYMQRRSAEP
jgi:regulator of PEP synthase PpsR (kinase-PPPase family)